MKLNTLSPVLWRKLPGSRSAGRVQSVALRLVCDRELEIALLLDRPACSALTGLDPVALALERVRRELEAVAAPPKEWINSIGIAKKLM